MLFLWIYSLFYRPFLFLVSLFSGFNSKLKKGFQLRQKKEGIKPWLDFPEKSQPIWIHCASGELEYAKPVIRQIKEKNSWQPVMVTYFSPSVEKSLSQFKEVDFYCPTPWDSASDWKEFIKHHQPKALLIARTDLWPMMIRQAELQKVPRLLFSKTHSGRKNGWQKLINKNLLPRLNDIFCVSEKDRENLFFDIRPFKEIHATGDTRYDQCLYRINHGRNLKPLNNFYRPIFVAGSTWPSDETTLLPLVSELIKDVSFIIAPHEPNADHLEKLIALCKKAGLSTQLYSETQSWDPQAVLIIDQVGILADIYGWAQFAFIGGSMSRSVHSVMEALAQGLLTFVGPNHENNREALDFKETKIKDMTPVQVIKNSDELTRRFSALYRSWSPSHQLDLKMEVKRKSGASALVLKWLENNQTDWTFD